MGVRAKYGDSPRTDKILEDAYVLCSSAVREKMKKLLDVMAAAQKEFDALKTACPHHLLDREYTCYATTDTLGKIDGEHHRVTCTLCGKPLWEKE